MRPEDLVRAKSVFDTVIDAPVPERDGLVQEQCGEDAGLRDLVEELLAEHDRGLGDFLEPPSRNEATTRKLALPPPVPDRLGSYEISERIGAGGMGEVYRAYDTALAREVAIKVLRTASDGDDRWLARFRREATLLASFSHPNVAVVYSFEREEGFRFFTMELVQGQSLARMLGGGPLPPEMVLRIGRYVCKALDAAHRRGIVHRDLKPSNVMVTREGVVKVLDFGIAKRWTAASNEATTLTDTGAVLGTPGYISPEQVRGRAVDARTDIWSFGCLLYELLAGRPAFPGRTQYDRLEAAMAREPDWALLPSDLPRDLDELMHACLVKDRERRLDTLERAYAVLARKRVT